MLRGQSEERPMPSGPFKKLSRLDPSKPLAPTSTWTVPMERFIGWGCMESDAFAIDGRVDEDYECVWEAEYARKPIWRSDDGYSIHAVEDFEPETVVLVKGAEICGFYMGGQLWIDSEHRGRKLGCEMVLAMAEALGRSPVASLAPMGYSPAGMAVHEAAWATAVKRAVADGLPVPAHVVEDAGQDDAPAFKP
jgi:hypothetical protein